MIGKGGERQAIGGDLDGRRQLRLDLRDRGVHARQRLEHVDVPGEEQIDFGGAAAGGRPDDARGPARC